MFKKNYNFTVSADEKMSKVFGIEGLVERITFVKEYRPEFSDERRIYFSVKARKKDWLRFRHELVMNCKTLRIIRKGA